MCDRYLITMKSGMRCRRLYQLSKSGLIAVLRSLNGGVAYQYSSMRSPAYLAVCYLALPSGDHRCLFDFYRRKSSPYCYILPAARQRMASTMMATASSDHSAVQELSSALFGELSLGGDDQGEIDWERTAGLAQRCADSLRTGTCARRATEGTMLRAMHGMAWHGIAEQARTAWAQGQLIPVCGQLLEVGISNVQEPSTSTVQCMTQCCRVIGNIVLDHRTFAGVPAADGNAGTSILTPTSAPTLCSNESKEMPGFTDPADNTRAAQGTAGGSTGDSLRGLTGFASFESRHWGFAQLDHRYSLVPTYPLLSRVPWPTDGIYTASSPSPRRTLARRRSGCGV